MLRKNLLNLSALTLLCISTFAHADIKDYCTVANVKYVSKNALMAYAVSFGITAIHEFGHSLASKLLCGTPFDINLGGDEHAPVLAKVPGVTFRGFNPLAGYAGGGGKPQYTLERPLRRMAYYYAGPLFGACGSACAWYLFKRYDPSTEYNVSTLVTISLLSGNIVALLPLQGNTDGIEGYKAYRQWRYGELE